MRSHDRGAPRFEAEADEKKATPNFKDGILKVHLPMTEEPRPEAIDMKVA
jgi:hypothetical protein